MKGNSEVLKHLNKILYNELVAINQYFLHSKMFKDWGLTELAEHEYHESIDEMKHADALVERILFLEGIPNLQDLGQLRIGETPKEMLECDLQLEHIAHTDLVARIQCCKKKMTSFRAISLRQFSRGSKNTWIGSKHSFR